MLTAPSLRSRALTTTLATGAVALVLAPFVATGTADAALLGFTAPVSGTATVARTGDTVPVPAGTVTRGQLNGSTVTSSTTVPTTTTRTRLPGFGMATVTVRVVETRPTVTTLAADGSGSGTAYFRIEVPSVVADGLPGVNLVRSTCRTSETSAALEVERFDLLRAFPVTGTFTIPAFTQCGVLRDQLVTNAVSGPGNTLDLQVGPATLG